MPDANKYKGTGNSAKDAELTKQNTKTNKETKRPDNQVPTAGVDNDKLANPDYQMNRAQQLNRARKDMSPEMKKEAGVPDVEVYDPGDSDGDNKAVSPDDGNVFEGAPKKPEEEDPFKDTKAAWDHLAGLFGEKVTALQNELEGRLGEQLTPTERETNNPFAGDDVPASKEMGLDDVKAAAGSAVDDVKALASGIGEIGGAAADVAGAAVKDGTRATIKEMGIDTDAVKETGKTLAGLSGLFSSGDNPNTKVPDGNWAPKSINDLFKW